MSLLIPDLQALAESEQTSTKPSIGLWVKAWLQRPLITPIASNVIAQLRTPS